MENTKLYIIDVDDVIFPLGSKWLSNVLHDKFLVNNLPHIKEIENALPENYKAIALRDTYYLDKFLQIPEMYFDHFMNLYILDGLFYDKLSILKMGHQIRELMRFLKERGRFTFLTHAVGGIGTPVAISKKRAIERLFGDIVKYDYIAVASPEEKSEVVKNQLLDWTGLFEDNLKNVAGIIETTAANSKGSKIMDREIFVPWYGYNDSLPLDFPEAKLKVIKGSIDHVGKYNDKDEPLPVISSALFFDIMKP